MTAAADSPATVVNVRTDAFDVYIGGRFVGRPVGRLRASCLPRSMFANPFRVGRHGTQAECLLLFEALWRGRLTGAHKRLWRQRLRVLRGQRLGCWCAPEPCHGDVLVRLLAEFDHLLDEALN